jgi:hypothetical protein
MKKHEFLGLMKFPMEWESLGMYPEDLFASQVGRYKPGHEEGSEHDRNGAFHWWLRQDPSRDQLERLLRLTFLDPDTALGEDVRTYIRKSSEYDAQLAKLEAELMESSKAV